MTNFLSFNLPEFILSSLSRLQITTPTPVQAGAIPHALNGKDILASAQTGTGKTIAYLVPLIANLLKDPYASGLILAPTRELALQVKIAAERLIGRGRNSSVALLIGGESIYNQITQLKRIPRIVIGTPGRVIDHLERETLLLENTNALVLDEMDRMLDIGFSDAIERIVSELPENRQTYMFSATMPPSIVKLSRKYLNEPERIAIGDDNAAAAKIQQDTLKLSGADKFPQLVRELNTREGSVIIFVKTKMGADQLAEKLQRKGHNAEAIHGDLRQRHRDRVIRDFRNQKSRILVATDVAARGLDIPHVMHVINYDLPQCPEDYIHRIGRTGRAGMEGFALSFISPEDNGKWKAIHRLMNPDAAPPATEKRFSKNGGKGRFKGTFSRSSSSRSASSRSGQNSGNNNKRKAANGTTSQRGGNGKSWHKN
jgi:superfamily II DNA/RNA helicase